MTAASRLAGLVGALLISTTTASAQEPDAREPDATVAASPAPHTPPAATRPAAPPPVAPPPVAPAATQALTFEVLTEPRAWSPALVVLLHGADAAEPTRLALPRDAVRQGFHGGTAVGTPRRFLDVELLVDGATLWRRVVPVEHPDRATLSFLVEQDGPRASRVAWFPYAGGGASAGNTVTLAVAFGWGALVLGYVLWLARRA